MAGMRALGRHRAGASPRPACEVARIQLPIYRQEDRPRLQAGSLPRRHASRASPIAGFPLLASAKLLAEGVASRKKNGRLRARPPSARAIPSAAVLGRFSMSEGFHHFDIEEAKARPPIRMLKHSTASDPTHVCRSGPGTVLKPKRRELPMQPSS